MKQSQEIIYEIKNSIFRENTRPSNHPSIILANRRNVHMNYVKCNAILWDEQSDKLRGPVEQVYHRVVVHEPNIKTSTSLPLKKDKLADSRTTFITTHDHLTYQNEYKCEGNDTFRPIKKLAKSNVISQYQNSKQQIQKTDKKKSLFDSSKNQHSVSHYSDNPYYQNRQESDQKLNQQKHKNTSNKNYHHFQQEARFSLLGNKGIREVQQFDLSAQQIQNQEKLAKLRKQYQEMQKIAQKKRRERITLNDEIFNTQRTIKKQQQHNYATYSNENSYGYGNHQTKTEVTPRFEKNYGRRIMFTQNSVEPVQQYNTYSKESFVHKNQQSTNSSLCRKGLWNSQIIRNQQIKSNLPSIYEYNSGSKNMNLKTQNRSDSEDDRLSVNSKSSNHVVIKSTCNIYDLKKDQNMTKIDINGKQSNRIKLEEQSKSSVNSFNNFNVVKMTREQYQQYKRNKQAQQKIKKDRQIQIEQVHHHYAHQINTPQWGSNNTQSNLFEQNNTQAFFYPQRQVVKRRRLSLSNNAQNEEKKESNTTKKYTNYGNMIEENKNMTNSLSRETTNIHKLSNYNGQQDQYSYRYVAMDKKNQAKMTHCPSNPNLQFDNFQYEEKYKQASTARQHDNKTTEDITFYKDQLAKALRRQQELINLYSKEQMKSHKMEQKIKQLEETLSTSSHSPTKKPSDKYEVDQSLLLTTHLMIMMVEDQKRKLNEKQPIKRL